MTETARRGRVAGLVFGLVWLSCVWFGSWEWNPNGAVRLFAAIGIVEQGDPAIDRFAGMTIDKASFGGRHYSDKAPGVTLMALPAVAMAERASGRGSRDLSISMYDAASSEFMRLRTRLAVATGAALFTALAAAMLVSIGAQLGGGLGAGAFAALGFALGTPIWGWSTTLFGHAPVAALFVVAIWAVWRGTGEARPSPGHAAIAGAALGWAVVVEHSAVLTGAPIGLWALWRLRRFAARDAGIALAAAAVPAFAAATVLGGYNWLAFGDPFTLGYQGVVGFDGMNEGIFGLTYPKPGVAWEVTGGSRRGLVWVAPVALAAVVGLGRLAWRRDTRALGVTAIAGSLVALAYNAAYFYWDGGNSTGPRHLVPALAYLALGLAAAWGRARWRGALLALLALSVGINLVIAAAEITTGGEGDWPLVSDVLVHRFLTGNLRTLPSEWLGWDPWSGLGLYLLLASGLVAAIVASLGSARPAR